MIFGALLAAGCCSKAWSTPCSPFAQILHGPALQVLAGSAARQLHAPDAEVVRVFRAGSWRMVYVDTHRSDETIVFFSGDPGRRHCRARWSGAARLDEADAMRRWAEANARGIPDGLARCFGWYVTQGRQR